MCESKILIKTLQTVLLLRLSIAGYHLGFSLLLEWGKLDNFFWGGEGGGWGEVVS